MALAGHLKRLSEDEEAYEAYFRWRDDADEAARFQEVMLFCRKLFDRVGVGYRRDGSAIGYTRMHTHIPVSGLVIALMQLPVLGVTLLRDDEVRFHVSLDGGLALG